jgi:multiple sugar transport system permease protein
MPAPRRKRLPSDFFDRLLSNQTDDQINDLLTSLVDEQIAPVADTSPEDAAAAAVLAAPKKRAKDFHRDKIEDSIITRDETLEEDLSPAGEDALSDELIPRSARMQATGVQIRPKAEAAPAAPAPAAAPPAAPPSVAPPPSQARPLEPVVNLPGLEELYVPPELLSGPTVEEKAKPDHGLPSFDLTAAFPPETVQEPPSVSRIVSVPPPGVHGAPARPVEPETKPAPAVPPPPMAPAVSAAQAAQLEERVSLPPLPSHEELLGARRKARWQKVERKPKPPKLAVPTPSISFQYGQPSPMDLILGLKAEEKAKFRIGRLGRTALLFLLPAFIGFSLFSWYPMLKGLFISLLHYAPTGVSTFVGVANYARAFQDQMFWRTLLHAGWFCLLVMALGFWIPVLIAVFLNELRWGKGVLKFLFFLPFLMPTVPAAILWQWIMDQGFGLLNAVLATLGLANPHIGWLTDPRLAMFSIALLYIWKNTGWAVLIYSAALTNVDDVLYEEAELDGASIWDRFWQVTMPSMRTVIGVMLIITVINTLQIFTEVYILTQGGPMHATEVIASYIYKQAFFYMDIGYASALSMILLLLLLGITLYRLRRLNPEGE